MYRYHTHRRTKEQLDQCSMRLNTSQRGNNYLSLQTDQFSCLTKKAVKKVVNTLGLVILHYKENTQLLTCVHVKQELPFFPFDESIVLFDFSWPKINTTLDKIRSINLPLNVTRASQGNVQSIRTSWYKSRDRKICYVLDNSIILSAKTGSIFTHRICDNVSIKFWRVTLMFMS